jgi:hypothetical protein
MVRTCLALGLGVVVMAGENPAFAGDASVSVGPIEPVGRTYARPPQPVVIAEDEPDSEPIDYRPPAAELYRSPFRLEVGPTAVTSGQGLGLGLGVAANFGRGTVGARLAAGWMRGEVRDPDRTSALGQALAQYTGELTLDLHKRGPLHPVVGMGFGLAHVSNGPQTGNVGIGVGRIAIEYALGLDDADVRIGGGVSGALAGPADREVEALRGYALIGGAISIGF